MTSKSKEPRLKDVPDIVTNPSNGKKYLKGRFLGKGGFARCYELTDADSKKIYAGKIVSKSLLTKPHQKDKMSQEIAIHRSLKQKHIVDFVSFFEDSDNVYIILELCRRRSLMEMHKRRRQLSEAETRYFLRQIVEACLYLHDNKVIHRDLKLGNLFLNDNLEIKLGDFGLATRLDYEGERKKTLCGTPNYIAPEVLNKRGHSYEVDSWSLGCIVYTLLVGKPPFETSCLKDTYSKIKKNEYNIPVLVDGPARNLINSLLRSDPTKRPSMKDVLMHDFLIKGYMPTKLPISCLTMAPRFDSTNASMMCLNSSVAVRKPLCEINKEAASKFPDRAVKSTEQQVADLNLGGDMGHKPQFPCADPDDYFLEDLKTMVKSVMDSKPSERPIILQDEAEEPASIPIYWIGKWVDYTDKYGIGYQLSDNSVGVLFNDSTRIVLLADGQTVHYIERDGVEHYYTLKNYLPTLTKKVTLLTYFNTYMNEHLLKAGDNVAPRETDDISRLPYLRTWFRTRSAIVLHLTNGTLQINFFQDHTKIIICPLMEAVTYIDEKREFRTYKLKSIERYGCSSELASRLRYARTMIDRLIATKNNPNPMKSDPPLSEAQS